MLSSSSLFFLYGIMGRGRHRRLCEDQDDGMYIGPKLYEDVKNPILLRGSLVVNISF